MKALQTVIYIILSALRFYAKITIKSKDNVYKDCITIAFVQTYQWCQELKLVCISLFTR